MKIMLLLVLSLVSVVSLAGTPYIQEIDNRFNLIEARATNQESFGVSSTSGQLYKRIARFTYNTSGAGSSVGVHSTGVFLPAKSAIVRDFLYIDTAFTDSGAGTVQLSCEDAGNIKPAVDFTAFGLNSFQEGSSGGTAAQFVGGSAASIAAVCEITATVGGVIQSTGKMTGWIEYIVLD